MKAKLFQHLGRALAACLLSSLAAAAQEAPAASKETPGAAAAGQLVVQVEYFKGAQPAFQPVPGSSWFGRFAMAGPQDDCTPADAEREPEPWCKDLRRLEAPPPRPNAEMVRAVDVKTRMNDDGRVEIVVGVHLGVKHFDRFKEVGKYYAAAGERVAAHDLRRFGVVPFRFRVLRVRDAAAAPPSVVNLTQSVEAVVTDFTPTPLPRGTLTLRNLSPKRVRAVYVKHVVEGRERLVGFVAGREGKTIMEPGGSAVKEFGTPTGGASGAGFTPAAVESLVVASVVFEDYTFEGEPEPAGTQRAFAEGARAQLPALVALVREALAAPDVESPDAVRRLRERVASLGGLAPESAVGAVIGGDPRLESSRPGRWKTTIEGSMHAARRALIDDLGGFEKKFQAAPADNSFKLWLKQKQGFYETWLARL